MRKTYKYRIYLTNGQRRLLNTMLEECRWVYNQMLEAHAFAYEHSLTCNRYDLINLLSGWKEQRPSLKLVHSQVLQNVAIRLDLAVQAFFRRVKAGAEDVGYPRYKKPDRYRSITYPQYGNGVEIRGTDLIVSKIGRIKVVWHRPVEGTIKTVSLKRSLTNKWYVTFSVEIEPRAFPPSRHVVGVDMGLGSFFTTSEGDNVANPRFFRRDEADLQRVQQRKDEAKNAHRWNEHRRRKKTLARIHERIRFRREDFAHKRSRELVNTYVKGKIGLFWTNFGPLSGRASVQATGMCVGGSRTLPQIRPLPCKMWPFATREMRFDKIAKCLTCDQWSKATIQPP